MNMIRFGSGTWIQRVSLYILTLVGALLIVGAASADEWLAERLRGRVLVLADVEWVPLQRGDIVSDDRHIRTLASGRVTFVRGNETIELGGDTQIQIVDNEGRRFTRVLQAFGTVSVEAEVEQVQHFSVETPTFAAVVKGTRFTVRTDGTEGTVSVQRGRVAVSDSIQRTQTQIAAGQSAEVRANHVMQVMGRGQHAEVLNFDGTPVSGNNGNGNSGNSGNSNSDNSGNGNSGNNGNGNSGNSGNGNSGNSGNGNSGSSGNSGSGGDDDDDDDD